MPRIQAVPDHADDNRPTKRARLAAELTPRSWDDLDWATQVEGLNRQVIVNRALQLYRRVMEAQENGGSTTIDDPRRGEPERVLFI